MKVHVLPSGPLQTNAYLLTESASGQAVLIDAPGGIWEKIQPLLQTESCALKALWLTHGHWDHTQDAARFQSEGVPIFAHEADRVLIEKPEVMSAFLGSEIELKPARIDHVLTHGQRLPALGREIEVRHVPGHCPGNVLFYFSGAGGKAGAAFVGDALFAGSIGRTDLPGGNPQELERSIRRQIYTLPEPTRVFPGHGPRTTVGVERATNPFVSDVATA